MTDKGGKATLGSLRMVAGIALMLVLIVTAACAPAAAPSASPTAAKPAAAATPAAKTGDSAGASAKPAGNADWDNLVAAAKKEGKVAVVIASGAGYEAVMAAFEKAYPDIKVEADYQHGADFRPKVAAERAASQYLRDLYIGASVVLDLKKDGYLDPLRPVLTLPEVVDDSKWPGGLDAAFMDKEKYDFAFEMSVKYAVSVNRDAVPESQLNKVDDLLEPQWGPKLAIIDPRRPGSSRDIVAFFLKVRGEPFVRKLLAQPMSITTDYRQIAEWAIRGKNPIGIGITNYSLNDLKKEGLTANIKPLAPETDIGALASEGNGGVGMFNHALHPNAAKVFVNWLLSKDGQTAWVKNVEESSRRLDVPPGPPEQHPDPKRSYVLLHTEENIHWASDVDKIAKEVIK